MKKKKNRAITSHSNCPIVNLQNQHIKDATYSNQTFRIIQQHFGESNIIHSIISNQITDAAL
jgi:hypothetical protein